QAVAEGSLIPVDIAETAGISLQTHLISLNGQNNEFLDSLLELGRELSY
ncbi:LysR family transcriptional regulator, partial [Clostridium perfringens]